MKYFSKIFFYWFCIKMAWKLNVFSQFDKLWTFFNVKKQMTPWQDDYIINLLISLANNWTTNHTKTNFIFSICVGNGRLLRQYRILPFWQCCLSFFWRLAQTTKLRIHLRNLSIQQQFSVLPCRHVPVLFPRTSSPEGSCLGSLPAMGRQRT